MTTGWNAGRRLGVALVVTACWMAGSLTIIAPALAGDSRPAPSPTSSQASEAGKTTKNKARKKARRKPAAVQPDTTSAAVSEAPSPAAPKAPTSLSAAPAAAKSGPKSRAARRAPSRRVWGPFDVTGSLDFQSIYDSNIFRYSPINLDRARAGTFKAGEFDLETFDDFIFMVRPNLNFAFRLLGSKPSAVRFSYTRWQYFSNSHKTNDAWAVRLRQPTIDRDFLELSYSFAPMALIRPLGDRGPFEPYSTTPYLYYPFEMCRNTFLGAYQRRLNDRLTARFEGARVIRYYNQRFIENDNWEWNGTLNLSYVLGGPWRIGGRYTYSNVKARALDTVGETRSTTNDGDPSYDRDLYQASVGFVPKGGFLKAFSAAEIMGQYQAYYYTSKLPYWEDNTHVGRKDEVYVVEGTLGTRPMVGPVAFELGYRYTMRESSSGAASDLEEDKNYHNHRGWVGWSLNF